MKKITIKNKKSFILIALIASLLPNAGCKKYLDIALPSNQIAGEGAFLTDASTSSVLSGIFYNIVNSSFTAGSSSIGFESSLYTDELTNINPNSPANAAFYTNNIQSANVVAIWNDSYKQINACNVAIEGINNSKSVLTNKNQYLGEAYFARAWLFFNLVNLYGGVPLAITTDYKVNNTLSRATTAQVNAQILSDLKMAQSLLPDGFHDGTGSVTALRTRPGKAAATALLARFYLYTGDWANAEAQSSDVIGNADFKLGLLSQTFLATGNNEAIWALSPTGAGFVADYNTYNGGMPATIPAGSTRTILSYNAAASLSDSELSTFEPNDGRFTTWIRSTFDEASNKTYYFPNKYKANVNGVENVIVLRLAEQYLIRAEARARQNTNISSAQGDLNALRTRAGLAATAAANQADLLTAVLKERRCELFTESGHRFFDLKRTGTIDAVMTVVAQQKSTNAVPVTWNAQKQLWPISATDIIINPNLAQNPGYN